MPNLDYLAKIYYNLIKSGAKTIDDVPDSLKDRVNNLLAKDENQ